MDSVEFECEITKLTKNMMGIDATLAQSVLQRILIGQLSVSPRRLDMALESFKKYLETGVLEG